MVDGLASSRRETPGPDSVRPGADLSLRIGANARLSDMKAFYATFALKLERFGKTYFENRVIYCGGPPSSFPAEYQPPVAFDDSWDVTLFNVEPFENDLNYRWPFSVSEKFWIEVILQTPTWLQYWRFCFHPGREYSEPLLVGRMDPREAAKPTEAKP